MKTNTRVINQDPWTLNNLSSLQNSNDSIFVFQQNGIKYKFLKNSMIKAYEHNGQQTTNPYTREILPTNTLNRLSKLQTLNSNETNMLQGVNSILREVKFTYKNNNDLKLMRRKVADNYIQNMLELNNNISPSHFQAVKNSLIRKGRL